MTEGARLPEDVRDRPGRLPVVVVLENLRSAFNVGSILRTADAVLVEEIVLAGYTGRPPNPKVLKTSLGAEESVPWRGADDAVAVVDALRRSGRGVWAVETTPDARLLHEVEIQPPAAIVFGNEVDGVSPACLAAVDGVLALPMEGLKNSINVATAFGVVAYELWRRWRT